MLFRLLAGERQSGLGPDCLVSTHYTYSPFGKVVPVNEAVFDRDWSRIRGSADAGKAYGILRTAKIKTLGNMGASLQHTFRERDTPNADPRRISENTVLHGPASTRDVLADWHDRAPDKIRSNAVHGLEYFVGGSPERMAQMTRNEQDSYFGKALDWIKDRHGSDNVLSAVIHRDETTPHMTVMTIPLDAAGKLNARSFVGNRSQLSEMQTDFAKKVSEAHGLRRGVKGSVATHERVQRVYATYTGDAGALTLPEREKGSFLSRGESEANWCQRTTEAVQDVLTGVELRHRRDMREARSGLALAEISRDTWQARAERAEAELEDLKAADIFLFDALEWSGLGNVVNAAQDIYQAVEERVSMSDMSLIDASAEDPARLQLMQTMSARKGFRQLSPEVLRFDQKLVVALERHGVVQPPDAHLRSLPFVRAALHRLQDAPLRDPLPEPGERQGFQTELEAVLDPSDLRRLKVGDETPLTNLAPSRLDQLRLAYTYLQVDPVAGGTASFSALSDRLADAELHERHDRPPRDSLVASRH